MPDVQIFNLGGVQVKLSPLLTDAGELIHAVNADCYNQGGKKKRPGYGTFLGTIGTSPVTTLFDWHKNDGTTFWLYGACGTTLKYSSQGTGAWTTCGNGTIGNGARVGHTVLGNTLIIGDGVGSTRHTTDGVNFTDTPLAPVGEYLEEYQGRAFIGGTASTLFYSTANDGTNWSTSGTSDSSSINIPGAGKFNGLFKSADRLISSKNSGNLYRWDGYALVDTSTNLGPTSIYSLGTIEDYKFYVNREGGFGYGGSRPEIITNGIEKFFYNDSGSGIRGSAFETIPGAVFYYDWFISCGSATDDLTNRPFTNLVIDYDYRFNELKTYDFADKPTAFLCFKNNTGAKQFIFGDGSGQCYDYSPTYTSDNGKAIPFEIMGFIHGATLNEKKWRWFRAQLNPGNEAKVQVAITDNFDKNTLKWVDLGDCSNGVVTYRFPEGSRGRFLFWKVSEYSSANRVEVLGFEFNAETIDK
jgi:hypothetical protein